MGATNGRIRVIIADDHPMVREGVRSMLVPERFEVVGEAATGREAVELAARHKPDLVLLDFRMPDMDGPSAIKSIKGASPETAVLVLSTFEDEDYLFRSLASGASGYLLKGVDKEELLRAADTAARGESIVDESVLQSALRRMASRLSAQRTSRAPGTAEALTNRELEIVALLAKGLTNREIGRILGIAEGTARAHVRNILGKLGVSGRTEAAVWAVTHGLVPGARS